MAERFCAKRHAPDKRELTSLGEVQVPEVEAPEKGMAKFSIDYMKLEDHTDKDGKACVVMVNHEDGGILSYLTPGKGIQGESY